MSVIGDLIQKAQAKFDGNEFDKFIHSVCFPKFKSFAPNVTIEFRFPITLIVGPNGGGKSSILHAVWGMPFNHSTSRFWFSTPVDPIDFNDKDQNRYWYAHYIKSINRIVESRKMCGNKRHGYWEPTRPAQKEGMQSMPKKNPAFAPYMSATGDRWNAVVRAAHYFNAKAESSAFDRFFNSTSIATLYARQDYFVKYSKKLKEVIGGTLPKFEYYGVERVERNVLLTNAQLSAINRILQKNYKSARYINHKFYDRYSFSPSVIFETASRSYSECFAGSGELAVVNFVLALENLKPYDLLLLDEPETSLHPGAQERLTEHLLRIVSDKHIQVIISTHSQTFVELLPASALIVLEETPSGIAPRALPTKSSAFERLGVVDNEKITILTEDKLLKAVVDRALLQLPKPLQAKLAVVSAELGVSEMLSNQARAHLQANAKVLMVLDGDQKEVADIFEKDPDELSAKEQQSAIDRLAKLQISIIGSNTDLQGWMRWCKKHVVLIDKICPEQILLQLLSPDNELLHSPDATNQKFKSAVKSELKRRKNESTSEAQYHILKHKLSELTQGDDLHVFLGALAEKMHDKLKSFEAA